MNRTVSFTKHEKSVAAKMREQLGLAESDADVKKFFVQRARELLSAVSDNALDLRDEDIALQPDHPPYYRLDERLTGQVAFQSLADSDLPLILERLAEKASHRCKHLAGHPEKTEARIRSH